MRSRPLLLSSFGALIAAAGCASILGGIPDVSTEWCQQPANKHAFCEDFDHANAFGAWPASPSPPPGTTRGLAPGRSLPYAMDTMVGPLGADASAFTGLETSFAEPFDDVKVGADILVAQVNFDIVGMVATGAGFMLLSETNTAAGENSLCIGLGLTPSTLAGSVDLALFLVPNSTDCVTVNPLQLDADTAATDSTDAGSNAADAALAAVPVPNIVGEIYLQTWTHLSLEVQRNPDNSGTITFSATPTSGAAAAVPFIPPNSLSEGVPSLGLATDITGPSSGPFEIEFDNITVDFGSAGSDASLE